MALGVRARGQRLVRVGAAIAEELPGFANLGDRIQIQIGGEHFILVARGLRDDLAARVAEVTGAVELADIPGLFPAHAIDRSNEIAVSGGVRGLLQLPEIFAQSGDGGRRIEDDLRAVQPQRPRAFRKMAVVTDVEADLDEAQIEHRITEISGPEVKLLPEAGR